MNEGYKISKDESLVLKGIAVTVMIVHHLFTFPSFIVSGNYEASTVFSSLFNSPTKICVSIFAFITGWAFALSDKIPPKKAAKKIITFLLNYWTVLIPLMIVAAVFFGFSPAVKEIVYDVFALKCSTLEFCWYVSFYIVSLVIFCVIRNALDKNIFCASLIGVAAPIVIFTALKTVIGNEILSVFSGYLAHWLPCIIVGYICNKYRVFDIFEKYTSKIPPVIILIFSVGLCFTRLILVLSIADFIYCTLLCFAATNFMHKCSHLELSNKIFIKLGLASTNIWFIHGFFYNDSCAEVLQKFLYFSANPVLVFIAAILFFYIISLPFNFINKKTAALVSRI